MNRLGIFQHGRDFLSQFIDEEAEAQGGKSEPDSPQTGSALLSPRPPRGAPGPRPGPPGSSPVISVKVSLEMYTCINHLDTFLHG